MLITPNSAQFLQQFLAHNLKGEQAMTLKMIAGLDDTSLSLRLNDGLPTVATILHHSFAAGPWFLSVIRRRHAEWAENSVAVFEGNAALLLDACSALSKDTENFLATLSVEELVAEVNFNTELFPAVYMIDWQVVYHVHHRSMAVSTLRRNGVEAPSFYGPQLY